MSVTTLAPKPRPLRASELAAAAASGDPLLSGLARCTRRVSFEEFSSRLKSAFARAVEAGLHPESATWAVQGDTHKSGWWTLRVLSELEAEVRPPMSRVVFLPAAVYQHWDRMDDYSREFEGAKQVVIVDDASYSGEQMITFLEDVERLTGNTTKIFVVLAMCTKLARARLRTRDVVVCSGGVIQTLEQCLDGHSGDGETATYFDHKFPDDMSTDRRVRQFVSCDHDYPEPCFTPLYADRSYPTLAAPGTVHRRHSGGPTYYLFQSVSNAKYAVVPPATPLSRYLFLADGVAHVAAVPANATFVVQEKEGADGWCKTLADVRPVSYLSTVEDQKESL